MHKASNGILQGTISKHTTGEVTREKLDGFTSLKTFYTILEVFLNTPFFTVSVTRGMKKTLNAMLLKKRSFIRTVVTIYVKKT